MRRIIIPSKGEEKVQDVTLEDLDTPLYVQGRVMHLTMKCMYVQGLLPNVPNPGVEFYEQYFGLTLAELIVSNRYILWAVNFIRNAYPWGTLVAVSSQILVILPVHIYLHWDNKRSISESVFALMLCIMTFMSLQTTFFGRENFKSAIVQLKHLINEDEKMDEADPKNKLRKLESWDKWTNQVNIRYVIPFFSLGLISYAVFSLGPQRKLYTNGWFPFDVYASPIYEIVMFGWTLETILLFFLSNTLGIFGVFECCYIKVHFDNLCHKIRNVRKIAIRRIRERRRQRKHLVPVEEVMFRRNADNRLVVRPGYEVPGPSSEGNLGMFSPYVAVNMPGCAGNRGANAVYKRMQVRAMNVGRNELGMRTKMIRRERINTKKEKIEDLEEITAQELDKEMLFQQARFAKLHQDLISLSNHWGSCLNSNLMTLYFINLVLFAITALLLKTAAEITFKEIMCVLVCSQLVCIYFMYNFLFDLITHGSSEVSRAVYECDWYETSKPFKLSMLIMMGRANVPVQVTPTALNPLSLKNFADVAESAYKMLATMESFM